MFKKSYSRLLNLYFLGTSVVLIYVLLFVMMVFHLFSHFSFVEFYDFTGPLISSLKLIAVSVLISLPFASAVCVFILIGSGFRFVREIHNFLLFIDRSPLILFGLAFFIVFGERDFSLYFIGSLVACSKISRRWIQQSKEISTLELEAARSFGMGFPEIVKTLYLKRSLSLYLGHIFSVAGFLLTAVSPFVYFLPFKEGVLKLFSLSFFVQLSKGSEQLSVMVLILLAVYLLKFLFDSRTGFIEVEHG